MTDRKRRTSSFKDGSLPVLEVSSDSGTSWKKNTISLVIVCAGGAVAWAIAWEARLWTPASTNNDQDRNRAPVGAVALGYLSAICYLG